MPALGYPCQTVGCTGHYDQVAEDRWECAQCGRYKVKQKGYWLVVDPKKVRG